MARKLRERGVTVRRYASGKRSIQVAFSYRGVQCREVVAGRNPDVVADWNQAVYLLREINGRIARGAFQYSKYFPDSKRVENFEGERGRAPTFETMAAAYLAEIGRSIEATALRKYKASLDNFWGPSLNPMRMLDITPRDIKDVLMTRPMTLKTMRNHMTPARGVFDMAVTDEVIERDPLVGIKVARLAHREARSDYEVDPFQMDEIRAIVDACRAHRPEWLNYVVWMLFTGTRTGESYFLRWPSVDWRTESFRVEGTRTDRIEKRAKTAASVRDHIMLPAALAALRAQRAVTGLADGHVWLNPRGGKPLSDYDHTARVWDHLQKLAGVRRRNQYQTRHTYFSHMLSCGQNPLYVAKQGGHKNTEMLFRVYGKWVEQTDDTGFTDVDFHTQFTRTEASKR